MNKSSIKKIVLGCGVAAVAACMMTSCGSDKALYSWQNYQSASYNYSKEPTEENAQKLLEAFSRMEKKVKQGSRQVLPPGACAEKAYILLKAGKREEAQQLFDLELKNYPESKAFIEKIKKQLEQ